MLTSSTLESNTSNRARHRFVKEQKFKINMKKFRYRMLKTIKLLVFKSLININYL